MNGFSKFSLRYKIIIPVVVTLTIVLSINFFSKKSTLKEKLNHISKLKIEKTVDIIDNQLNSKITEIKSLSSVYTELPYIKWAFSVYRKTNNLDSASQIVKRNINNISNKLKETLDKDATIIIKTNNEKILYSSDLLNNYGSFNNGINLINNNLYIIESSTVYLKNKKEGTISIMIPFYKILKETINNKYTNIALFINNKYKKASDLTIPIGDNKYSLFKSSTGFYIDEKIFNKFNINNNNETASIINIDNYVYKIEKIKNSNIVAYIVQLDISNEIKNTNSVIRKFAIMAIILVIFTSLLLILYINKIIINPINNLTNYIQIISKGKVVDKLEIKTKDEIGVIYSAFNRLLDRTKELTSFTIKIGNRQYDTKLNNVDNEDELSISLLKMRDNLKEAQKQEELRKLEDEKRNWAANGLAKFAEILRQNNNDIQKLSDEIIKNLVHYIDAIQGGLFILNNNNQDDSYLELISAYAYNRKKFMKKHIKLGEGLVGACAIEQQSIYLTDIPDDYMKITSGLGKANPKNIFIVPLKIEDKIFGVIELASFDIIPKYKKEFIEKVCESIASTLNSVKINIKTKELLEQSQQQAEELAAQEEEMRQNMEEMQATQEELSRTKKETEHLLDNLDKINYPILNIDKEFNITYINEKGLELAGITKDIALKSKCYNIFTNEHCGTSQCRCFMAMQNKQTETGKTIIKSSGKEIIYSGIPIYDDNGNIIGANEVIIEIDKIDKFI